MTNQQPVVLRYRDGRTERGQLTPIEPTVEVVSLTRDDGQTDEVPFSVLKAVFFPRNAADDNVEPATGSTISVEFTDGEVIRGIANYNPERNGFYLFPHDRSKNDRIFVVNSAIVSIEVEKL
jgi:small nuclear ribonucleoprotein (snRNP)-like protein